MRQAGRRAVTWLRTSPAGDRGNSNRLQPTLEGRLGQGIRRVTRLRPWPKPAQTSQRRQWPNGQLLRPSRHGSLSVRQQESGGSQCPRRMSPLTAQITTTIPPLLPHLDARHNLTALGHQKSVPVIQALPLVLPSADAATVEHPTSVLAVYKIDCLVLHQPWAMGHTKKRRHRALRLAHDRSCSPAVRAVLPHLRGIAHE